MAGILDQSAKHWAVDAVVQAEPIKFELPLANGDTPIVEIRPQDASFRRFVDRCNAERSLVPRTPGYLRKDKRFAGTADQLAAAFPEMLRQAAAHVGLDGRIRQSRRNRYQHRQGRDISNLQRRLYNTIRESG